MEESSQDEEGQTGSQEIDHVEGVVGDVDPTLKSGVPDQEVNHGEMDLQVTAVEGGDMSVGPEQENVQREGESEGGHVDGGLEEAAVEDDVLDDVLGEPVKSADLRAVPDVEMECPPSETPSVAAEPVMKEDVELCNAEQATSDIQAVGFGEGNIQGRSLEEAEQMDCSVGEGQPPAEDIQLKDPATEGEPDQVCRQP